MMFRTRRACAVGLLVILVAGGCTSLRQVPPTDMMAGSERRDLRVDLLDGRSYEFDVVKFGADSLTGYRRRETAGDFAEYDAQPVAFGEVQRIAARRTDWYRTGLVALGIAVGAVVIAFTQSASDDGSGGDDGPVKPPPSRPN
jgi:hypothetical protein